MSEKLRDLLHGSRRIEVFIAIILASLAAMYLLGGETDSLDNADTRLETRLETILSSIDCVDRPQVMVTQTDDGKIIGVVIVADGVSDMSVRLNIQSAVKTLLNLETSRIEIIDRGR